MADVTPFRVGRGPDSDRGQLLAITGLLIAITLVVLAVLLNSVIYAENLSTRGSDVGGSDAAAFERAVESVGTERLEEINDEIEDDSDYTPSDGIDDLESDLEDWDRQAHAHVIRDGVYTNVSLERADIQIIQDDDSELVHNNWVGGEKWTVMEDVYVQDYVLEIEGDTSTDTFSLVVSNESEWRFDVEFVSSILGIIDYIEVSVDGPNGDDSCRIDDDDIEIDFVDETINGNSDCDDVAVFADGIEPPYDIEYENGDEVTGSYWLLVSKDVDDEIDDDKFGTSDDGDQPYVDPAIHSGDVALTYETDRIEYRTTVEIVPGEDDDD